MKRKREREGEKEGEEDRGGGDYTRARERNGRLKRTLNGRENANEADYSQICFEFVYTERRPRCFIFNAAAASRFRGLAALPSPGMMRGYNGRVSGVSSCVVCRSRCINSGESFQSFVANIFERIRKHIWWRKSLFDNLGKYIFGDSFSPGIFEKVQQIELNIRIHNMTLYPLSFQRISHLITNVIPRETERNDILFHTIHL